VKTALTLPLLIFSFCLFGQASSNGFELLIKQADSLYNIRLFARAAETYEAAIHRFPAKANANTYYNAGCSWSLAGKKDLAFRNLFKSARNYGYSAYSHIKEDTDLANLYKDKQWKKFTRLVENNYKKKYNIKLQHQLDKLYEADQKIRNQRDTVLVKYGMNSAEYGEVVKKIAEVDSINDKKISSILDKYGWPGPYSPDGEKIEAIKSFYLSTILQHAGLETQIRYASLLKEAVKKANARAKDFGYLQDRILQRQGKRQLYGTQLSVDKNNRPFVWPIGDVDNLDKRRREIGMQSMSTDLKMLFNLEWNLEEYKKQLKDLEAYVKIKD
jgi:hypothetical protein